jgi:hypothetical protein
VGNAADRHSRRILHRPILPSRAVCHHHHSSARAPPRGNRCVNPNKHQNTIASHPTDTALGFTASFGSIGCALFPFLTGAIASRAGVEALQPIMIALLVGMTIFWAFVPKQGRIQLT